MPKFTWLGELSRSSRCLALNYLRCPQILTRSTGSVPLGGEAGVAAPDLIDGNDPELVVDIGGQLEDS